MPRILQKINWTNNRLPSSVESVTRFRLDESEVKINHLALRNFLHDYNDLRNWDPSNIGDLKCKDSVGYCKTKQTTQLHIVHCPLFSNVEQQQTSVRFDYFNSFTDAGTNENQITLFVRN